MTDGRAGHARGRGRPDPRRPVGGDVAILYGFHSVVEALRNPRRTVRRLLATENALARLRSDAPDLAPDLPDPVRPDEISRLVEADAVHQGLYMEADPLPAPHLDELGPDAIALALDQVTDPHNVGAIVRSAAAFRVDALITTNRHSPAATGVLAKAASGGLEHVPMISVRNLGNALGELGERGFQRIGLDSAGGVSLAEIGRPRPVVLVLGAEGKGLRARTRACCDAVARLELPGAIASLNVSNAAAIALYAMTTSVSEA